MKLQYLKDSDKLAKQCGMSHLDSRMWNLIEPRLPGYDYKIGYPTFGLVKINELIKQGFI